MMNSSPYVFATPSVRDIMLKVLLALLPGLLVYVWVYGGGILLSTLIAVVSALIFEAGVLKLRARPMMPALTDLSAVLTAVLLALALPPLAPWWLIVVGVFFAIVIAKQLYGGLGYNPFNPAMVGYAVLLISFPTLMTSWSAPLSIAKMPLDWLAQWQVILDGHLQGHLGFDAITSATPLDYVKTELKLHHNIHNIQHANIFGKVAGKGAEWVALAYTFGGIYLLRERIISWHLPVAFLGALGTMAALLHGLDADVFSSASFHLLSGGTMLGAFFIVTDPVSGPTTPRGKLYFAVGVGFLTYVIRVWGGYPDGVAFAVLLMNMCVPMIDAHTQPRVFGHPK